jgi:hypothetical protein
MHSGKQHDLAAGNQNLSGRFLKPVIPTLSDLASQQAGETGQAGLANRSGWFCPGTPQNTFDTKTAPKRLKNLSFFEQEKP